MFNVCEKVVFENFYRFDGLLFGENRLCMHKSYLRELLMREAHKGGLMEHFSVRKTLNNPLFGCT